jgi:putative transposase
MIAMRYASSPRSRNGPIRIIGRNGSPDEHHFLTVCRYVERNALRAGLTPRAEQWRWGSLARRAALAPGPGPALSPWPIDPPADWVERVNAPLSPAEEEALRRAIRRGQPFGAPDWQATTAARLGLDSTLRPRGRPRKARDRTS